VNSDLNRTGDLLPHIAHVQQTLLRDDVFLPGIRATDPTDHAPRAVVTASSSAKGYSEGNVLDGIGRATPCGLGPWADGASHQWRSVALPAKLSLTWSEPINLREIHLTFDSGLERSLTLTLSDHYHRRQVYGAQPEIVSHYGILGDGQPLLEVHGNYLRKRVHRLNSLVRVSDLSIELLETNGAPEARLHEVRCYT
jgi:hypothetical protein